MKRTLPFTYLLRFRTTGQVYYGYYGRAGCHPNDLWTKYFSSSKIVLELVQAHGVDSFDFEVRRTFKSADEARRWERRVLERFNVRRDPRWLNQSNGGRGFVLKSHSAASREKISRARIGMRFTESHRESIGRASRGRVPSVETRRKISESSTGRHVSEETRLKLRGKASQRTHSPEARVKIGVAARGRKLSESALAKRPSNKRCLVEGKEFLSISEASRTLGIGITTIAYRISTQKPGYSLL